LNRDALDEIAEFASEVKPGKHAELRAGLLHLRRGDQMGHDEINGRCSRKYGQAALRVAGGEGGAVGGRQLRLRPGQLEPLRSAETATASRGCGARITRLR